MVIRLGRRAWRRMAPPAEHPESVSRRAKPWPLVSSGSGRGCYPAAWTFPPNSSDNRAAGIRVSLTGQPNSRFKSTCWPDAQPGLTLCTHRRNELACGSGQSHRRRRLCPALLGRSAARPGVQPAVSSRAERATGGGNCHAEGLCVWNGNGGGKARTGPPLPRLGVGPASG